MWVADAHRGDGKSFIVRADEILTAFLEREAAPRPHSFIRQLVGNASTASLMKQRIESPWNTGSNQNFLQRNYRFHINSHDRLAQQD